MPRARISLDFDVADQAEANRLLTRARRAFNEDDQAEIVTAAAGIIEEPFNVRLVDPEADSVEVYTRSVSATTREEAQEKALEDEASSTVVVEVLAAGPS